jgi:hypothetical protein
MTRRHLAAIVLTLILIGMPSTVLRASSLTGLPPNQDTDGDGLPESEEDKNGNGIVDAGETDPYNADTDRGGESDGSEVKAGRNPLDPTDDLTADADGDGLVNGIELIKGTDPKKTDSDGDGVNDAKDPFPLDPRYSKDENSNGLPDEWEEVTGLIKQPATPSRSDDPDGDGLTNAEELARGTDPLKSDTNRNGIDDKTDIDQGTNPSENACLSFTGTTAIFPDIADHWAKTVVQELRGIRILPDQTPLVRGYEQPSSPPLFRPDQPVTRYEFLKMALLSTCTSLRTITSRERLQFSDVRSDAPIGENPETTLKREIIYTALHFKIAEGYQDGTFRPNNPINRAEAVAMLDRASGLPVLSESGAVHTFPDVADDAWYFAPIHHAAERKIVEGYTDGLFHPERPITRAEAAAIINRTIRQNPIVNGYILP